MMLCGGDGLAEILGRRWGQQEDLQARQQVLGGEYRLFPGRLAAGCVYHGGVYRCWRIPNFFHKPVATPGLDCIRINPGRSGIPGRPGQYYSSSGGGDPGVSAILSALGYKIQWLLTHLPYYDNIRQIFPGNDYLKGE